MRETLDRRVSLDAVIAAFPVAFYLHDVEENLTIPAYVRRHPPPLPPALTTRVTTNGVAGAVEFEFALCCLIAESGRRDRRSEPRASAVAAAGAVFALHACSHLAQTIRLRRYTPGVVTAPLVALPYGAYLLHRLWAARRLDGRALRRAILLGAVSIVPEVLLAWGVGIALARYRGDVRRSVG